VGTDCVSPATHWESFLSLPWQGSSAVLGVGFGLLVSLLICGFAPPSYFLMVALLTPLNINKVQLLKKKKTGV
jgi:hypothetical protein